MEPRKKKLLDRLLQLAQPYLWQDTEALRYLQSRGLSLEPARFYSQLPLIDDIENSFEYRQEFTESGPYYDPTVFHEKVIADFLESIMDLASEFDPPKKGDLKLPGSFFWDNPAFSHSDAMAYWCVLRRYQPRRVVEIGAGFSSLVARMALRRNGHGELYCIEPIPRPWFQKVLPEVTLIEHPIQNLDVDELVALLSPGDVLFIDSTHTVKIGSDCLWLYLLLLPRVPFRIFVHVHDVFLPFGMNQRNAVEKHIHWTEQYLLMAYLLDNPRTTVFFSSAFAARFHRKQLQRLMGGKARAGGGSMWFTQESRRPRSPCG